MASAPLSRTHAASLPVIGVADSTVTGGRGAGSGTSSTSLRPNRNAVNGAESHSGDCRSTSASGSSIKPSTAGAAARMATERDSPLGDGPRSATTTSARGPRSASVTISVGSNIGWREQPSDT